LFSIACALFDQNTRGGIPSHASVRTISVASVSRWQTQFCRPFVFMVLRIAFPASPFLSQSSALPPGVGVRHSLCSSPLPPLLPRLPVALRGKSRLFILLRTLFRSCALFSRSRPLFSIACGLFCKNTRGGGAPLTPPSREITAVQRSSMSTCACHTHAHREEGHP
jgi:hypothetical protein